MKLINNLILILFISLIMALFAWILSKYFMLEYSKFIFAGWHSTVIEGVALPRLFIWLVFLVALISNLIYSLITNKKKFWQ